LRIVGIGSYAFSARAPSGAVPAVVQREELGQRGIGPRQRIVGLVGHRCEDVVQLDGAAQRLVQEGWFNGAQRSMQGPVDAEHDEQRRRKSAPGFQPAHRALTHAGRPRELLLGETEELPHAPHLVSQGAHPLCPVDAVVLVHSCFLT
jgi:hypothetical protein